MKLQELSKGEFINRNEEGCCDRKDQDVSEEVTQAKFHIKETLGKYLIRLIGQSVKMLEAEPNVERIKTVCRGIENMLILYHKFYEENEK